MRSAPGAAVVLALTIAACGHPREQALVDQFFSASRVRDKTAAQTVSTVFFDPKDQGVVRDFTIKKRHARGSERRRGDQERHAQRVGRIARRRDVAEDDLRDDAEETGRRLDDYGRDGGGAGSSAVAGSLSSATLTSQTPSRLTSDSTASRESRVCSPVRGSRVVTWAVT